MERAKPEELLLSVIPILIALAIIPLLPSQWRRGRLQSPSLVSGAWLLVFGAAVAVIHRGAHPGIEIAGFHAPGAPSYWWPVYVFGPATIALAVMFCNQLEPLNTWFLVTIAFTLAGCCSQMMLNAWQATTYRYGYHYGCGCLLGASLVAPAIAWLSLVPSLVAVIYDRFARTTK